MLQSGSKLIGKTITGTPATSACGIATLNHEIRDDAVEGQTIVEAVGGEIEEICDGDGCLAGIEGGIDISLGGVENDADILGRISRCGGSGDAVGHRESCGKYKKCLFHRSIIG